MNPHKICLQHSNNTNEKSLGVLDNIYIYVFSDGEIIETNIKTLLYKTKSCSA